MAREPMAPVDDFAAALRAARTAADLSQAELGARAGLTGSYVCMLELRRKPAPAPDVVHLLAKALGVDDTKLQELAALERTPEPVRRRVARLARDRVRSRASRDRLITTTIFHMARRPGFAPDHVADALGLPPAVRPFFGRIADRVRHVPSAAEAAARSKDLLREVPGREREALVDAIPRLVAGASAAALPVPSEGAAAPTPAAPAVEKTWRRVPVLATVPAPGARATTADALDVFHLDRRLWRPGAFVWVADDDDAWPRVEKGDWLLLDPRAVPRDGELVVVRDGGRARIRTLRRQAAEVRLDAARSDVPPLRLPESRLSLVGVVRWVMRPLDGPPPPRRVRRDDEPAPPEDDAG